MLRIAYKGVGRDGKLRLDVYRDDSLKGHVELELRSDPPLTLDEIRAIDLEQALNSIPRHLTPWLARPREQQ